MKKLSKILSYAGLLVFPIITFYLFEFYTHNPFTTMKIPLHLLNMLLFVLIGCFLFFLTGSVRIASMIETGFFMIYGLANYFVLSFRSAPIMPWDFASIKTAASVADNYSYQLDSSTWLVLGGFLILLAAELFGKPIHASLHSSFYKRLLPAFIFGVFIFGYALFVQQDSTVAAFKMYNFLFTPQTMCKRNGTATAFLMELQYLSVDKPEGYDAAEAEELLADYHHNISPRKYKGEYTALQEGTSHALLESQAFAQDTPNIIVIMNEAFSDPAVLGPCETNEDYMPFIHSLLDGAQNTQSGYMNVSVLGGNTPNTEFEFLTGNSLAFLPQGSIPYQQFIHDSIPSLPSHLKELGYETLAMHPYHDTGWDRNTVYPLLGFDTSLFLNDFEDAQYIRKYVSDQSCVDTIIESFENKERNTPLFLFNVTMQNHSSYSEEFDNFTPTISYLGTEGKNQSLNMYLSLLKETDQSFANLLSYFQSYPEETIIVFFGDHQPNDSVVEPVWKTQGKSGDSLTEEERYLRYKVPFIIWSNFDTEEAADLETSANYLGMRVLETADIPLTDYMYFLQELETSYPVITASHAVSQDGSNATIKDLSSKLNTYAKLQYYQLFEQQK